jgi:hypothetical protein
VPVVPQSTDVIKMAVTPAERPCVTAAPSE